MPSLKIKKEVGRTRKAIQQVLQKRRKKGLYLVLGLMLLIPLWLFIIAPSLLAIPADFRYEARIHALDNFYNEELGRFEGEKISKTIFSYEVAGREGENLLIKNVFYVRTPEGEKIFSAQRLYGIDSKTGKHVMGYGDKSREGYLFSPRHLQPGQNFTYWHVNYDAPALMQFQEEESINGLKVYRYESNYHADQTVNLRHLPGVPEERGVDVDINLQLWIEPRSGYLVKYEDRATAYYYSITTGERLHPWNQFHNQYLLSSIDEHVAIAKNAQRKIIQVQLLIPLLLGFMGVLLLIYSLSPKLKSRRTN